MRNNVKIIADLYAASDRKDIDAMMADLAPDAAWIEMQGFPYAGTYIGPQAVLDHVFGRIGADFEGFAFELDRLHDAGETVVATGSYSGTYRGTGKSFSCRVAHLWQVADGRITRFERSPTRCSSRKRCAEGARRNMRAPSFAGSGEKAAAPIPAPRGGTRAGRGRSAP